MASQQRRQHRDRRGVTIIIVLALMAITLSLSYAMVHTQATSAHIQCNANRQSLARQAAVTGLTMAWKKMHTGDWAGVEGGAAEGVDTTLHGSLGPYESYEVRFTTGVPADHPEYERYIQSGEFPYLVTLLSTGSSVDPADSQRVSRHQVRAVARLVPRQLSSEPTDWAQMQSYTLFQTQNDIFELNIPCRIEGPVRIQGKLELAKLYPNDEDAWWRYLADLNGMRGAGYPDLRPFNGTVSLPFAGQDAKYLTALTNSLGVPASDLPAQAVAADWVTPAGLATYQLYPGGLRYEIPAVSNTLAAIEMGPDPLTNPLGIYYHDTTVTLGGDVTVKGSLYCRDDIQIGGASVHFKPVELPPLLGTEEPIRLPAASCRNLIVGPTAAATMTGLGAVFDRLEVQKSPETVSFAVTGRVITDKFQVRGREPWDTTNWAESYAQYQAELADESSSTTPYFPLWMGQWGRDPKPRLTLQPDPQVVRYHWQNWNEPIFQPHPNDGGLYWDLLEWSDNP